MRVFFAAGGTAGHINPAIAIAEIIKNKYPNACFLFAACKNSMEERILTQAGYEITYINIHGIKRKSPIKNLRLLKEIPLSIYHAKRMIRSFSPDIVIGTGGYLSYPIVHAAQKLKIKTALHESNAAPGLTTKLLSKRANAVMVSMEAAFAQFPEGTQCYHVGTPLRSSFISTNAYTARKALGITKDQFFILSFGGSLGAEALNQCCINLMQELPREYKNLIWVHATGEKNFPFVIKKLQETGRKLPEGCSILPYIHNMAEYMAAADVVICRSGASTLAELSCLGKPSLLVPYPYATQNHQLKNAEAMANLGGAFLVHEDADMQVKVKRDILRLLHDRSARHLMGSRARLLQGDNTSKKILEALKI
jgi:UDP-N-acetylglucosamine--N-acetylmuramyl-(pentapeptide) pyrophosphoryl-undecaprenol N-acetylglucosamine transferase